MLRLTLALLLSLLALPAAAQTCREALALGLDVSGSVDDTEYRLQLEGLARALDHPQVREALFALPGAPVRLMVYEWSGPGDQRVLADWAAIDGTAELAAFRAELLAARRQPMEPTTAIAPAMKYGRAALETQAECWRLVLDVSGDGIHNSGGGPGQVPMGRITVNGLTIGPGASQPQLTGYFRAYVLRGPDAFVESALGFRDFEEAMVRKLLKELEILPITQAPATMSPSLSKGVPALRQPWLR